MPPTPGDAHVNRPLTNLSIAYLQGQDRFVASRVFPVVPVQKQSDRYFVYSKGDLLRDEAARRAPGTESAGMIYTIDNTPTYSCTKWALHQDVDDDLVANADAPLRPEQDAAGILTDKLLLRRDREFVSSYFKAGVWDTDLTGVGASPSTGEFLQFQVSTSDPIAVIDDAKETVAGLTGYMPNVVVMGPEVLQAVKNNAQVLDRIRYTQRGIITEEILASLFGVDEVVVPHGIVNTAVKGATDAVSRIFGKGVLVAYRPAEPCNHEAFRWILLQLAGLYGAGNDGLRSKRFRMEHLNSTRIENEFAWDLKVVATDCAAFLASAVA